MDPSHLALPPPEGPEYTPCACGHIEPEHSNALFQHCLKCGCLRFKENAKILNPTAEAEAVVPPPELTEEGRLRAQVEVLTQDAERDRGSAKVGARCLREGHQGLIEQGRAVIEGWRFTLSVALDLGTGAPWGAIHHRVKELRRLAAGEQQPECIASISGRCLREAESDTACDTDDGECVHGGRPGAEEQEPDDTDLTETDIDRLMAAGVPVQIVTAPPDTEAERPSCPDPIECSHEAALGEAETEAERQLAAVQRVRRVLEVEPVLNRSALEYRGLILDALMGDKENVASKPWILRRASEPRL